MSVKYKEIEVFYRIEWSKLLRKFYVLQKMSSYEIAERIKLDTGIDYTYRAIQKWLVKFGFIRSHDKALKNRVLTGRMDYSQRALDYKSRSIDYYSRDKDRGYLWAIGLKKMLKNKGDTTRLAKALGNNDIGSVSNWKNLRYRVTPEYQEKICAYFGLAKEQIFSEIKTFDVRKATIEHRVDHKTRLINQGYKYATCLRKVMYKKRFSVNDLAKKLGKPYVSISRWLSENHLVSPADQQKVIDTLQIPSDQIFT